MIRNLATILLLMTFKEQQTICWFLQSKSTHGLQLISQIFGFVDTASAVHETSTDVGLRLVDEGV